MCAPAPVVIRSVWAHNFASEFNLIGSLFERYPYVALDTEFPGIFFDSPKPYYRRTTEEQYAVMKSNVDTLNVIQLGLTLLDADGNLPDLGTGGRARYVWEFNFSNFDLLRDKYVPQSIKLLRESGIDLMATRKYGVLTAWFAREFAESRTAAASTSRSWITFHGAYDLAYTMKAITGKKLPETLKGFLEDVKKLFGDVYDIKSMIMRISCNGLYGGLEQVAKMLRIERAAGRSHQAGSDSYLIGLSFMEIRRLYLSETDMAQHAGRLYGLN